MCTRGWETFAVLLAPYCKQVVAIEESSAAMDDARVNCEGIANLELCHARAEDALADMEQCPDAIVLDPPRAGCHPGMLESLVRLRPKRVVYVSCDPSTLARDLKVLCAGGFQLRKVQPIDMFPQTHHVECVATLVGPVAEAGTQGTALTLASASPRRRELMRALGMEFGVQPSSIPEDSLEGELPVELVRRLALSKALAVAAGTAEGLGGVGRIAWWCTEADILGKPGTVEEARGMLARLRDNAHQGVQRGCGGGCRYWCVSGGQRDDAGGDARLFGMLRWRLTSRRGRLWTRRGRMGCRTPTFTQPAVCKGAIRMWWGCRCVRC